MREIEVLGVPLKERSVRESMRRVDEMFENGALGMIGLITMKGIMAAGESEEIKKFIEGLYLTVISDEDILTAAGTKSRARYHEVESNAFLEEFLAKIYRERKAVYLVGASSEALSSLKNEMTGFEEHLKIVGEGCVESEADFEKAVNEINMSGADVLISNLPSPEREAFALNNERMINVPVWLILREDMTTTPGKRGFFSAISHKFTKWFFKLMVEGYSKNH